MKLIQTLVLILLISNTFYAQRADEGNQERREKMESRIESQKIAFITQKLDLSPEEAQRFWPIYNEYQSKMKSLRQDNRIDVSLDEINDEEADAIIQNMLEKEEAEFTIKKTYLDKLKTVVPPAKIAKLYIIEQKFRQEILAKIKNKIGNKRKMRRRDDSH